jgi:hypothetical protein
MEGIHDIYKDSSHSTTYDIRSMKRMNNSHLSYDTNRLPNVTQRKKNQVRHQVSGFGGLAVSMLASGTQDRRFKPGRSRQIFRAKKSSECLSSEGK